MTTLFKIASLACALGIALGAFGAHALKDIVEPYRLTVWEKAVFYHLFHALGIFVVLIACKVGFLEETSALRVSYILLAGIIIFSGSLYTLVYTNTSWLGAITPLGGVLFIVGWMYLAFITIK